jgi:hypothetical protein
MRHGDTAAIVQTNRKKKNSVENKKQKTVENKKQKAVENKKH